jgi:4-diphosphocytidyl-2-C-methyl-D-erythritol kinase
VLVKSYAKLNLYLEVLKLRKDNYHSIKTIFERIDLCDKIILKTRRDKKIRVICASKDVPRNRTNLAYRSAKLLQDKFKLDRGVDIKIIKRIPVGAGLGGGSSNAAFTLLGLNRLWKLRLGQKELARYARKIGSDVAFFIYDYHYALGVGRGDNVTPLRALNKLNLWHILVVPKIKVSTPLIYRRWDELRLKKATLTGSPSDVKILTSALLKKELTKVDSALFNSLETVTAGRYFEVKRIRENLAQAGVKAILMSGSGPAVFGITSSRKEALGFSRQLRKIDKSWQVFVTKTV